MTVVRLGEFAWSRLEPAEGEYDLEWLVRAIDLAAEHGLKSVVGTPTAAPPAWLTQRYPDVLAFDQNGRPHTHGNRCHYRASSKKYLELCARIAERLAKRLGSHPSVIGWQIDNEYGTVSYDEETREQFQTWLRQRYGSLEELNRRWTTVYWSQEYSDWRQIPIADRAHHPSLMLDFRRFVTSLYREYQRRQIKAIRAHADPRQWITHNFMGWFDRYDHYELCADLDLASWDNYIVGAHLDPLDNGAIHDLTRGFKQKNFWLMETQPGFVNWLDINSALDRGEVRTMAWHAVGHGADAVLYWQWRSSLGGQEQYHGNIVASDGEPRPIYQEICEIGRDFEAVSEVLRGTQPVAQAAILYSYESRWAIDFQRHHLDFDPVRYLLAFYRPLRRLLPGVDIVHPSAELERYRVVIAPALHVLCDEWVEALERYIGAGGHLVLGARSGFKDLYNALLTTRQPGPLTKLVGARVQEYYALRDPVPLTGLGQATIWAEWLEPVADNVEVIASYGPANGWIDGQPAIVTRDFASGKVTYVGTWPDAHAMTVLITRILEESGVASDLPPSDDGVELSVRSGRDRRLVIAVNHSNQPKQVALPCPAVDLLTSSPIDEVLTLPPYGVSVLQEVR